MRVLMKVSLPVEEANRLVKAGKLEETIKSILEEQKPEAVYFTADRGKRTGLIFLHMQESAEIPKFAEPWFLAFNAGIEFSPVMAPEDLAKAGPAFDSAVKKYG